MMRAAHAPSIAARILGCWVALAACGMPARPAGTVVYASGADLESANPLVTIHSLARQVQRYALFVTLARYDAALRPEPYYARRWDWSADRRVLTLHLAPELTWHDGAPTTARDVVFTLDAARDPATGYPRYADLASLTDVRAVDDTTLALRFGAPQRDFPLVLCELPILPAHLLGSVARSAMRRAAFNLAPTGNGPFRFVERVPGQRWIFTRDASFPPALGGPPRLQRLVIAVVDEATTKFAGLVSGDLDVASLAPSIAALAREDPGMRVVEYATLQSNALILNTHRPPFDDVRVRRALELAIDRERVVRAALAGFALPAGGPVPPDNPLALAAPPRHEAGRADSLLDAAGWLRGADHVRWRDGRPFAIELLTVGSGDNAVEQLVQADLAARGIRVGIRQTELGAFLSVARAREKRFDMLITGIPGDLGLSHLAAMYDSRLAGGALDYAGFHTPELDALFVAAQQAPTPAAFASAWADIQRALTELAPAIWLYHARGVQGVTGKLHGVTMDLRGEMPTLATWWLADSSVVLRFEDGR